MLLSRCKGRNPTRWSSFRRGDVKVSVEASLDPTDASVSDGTTVRMRAYKNELESSSDKRGASFRVCVQARYAGGEEGDKHPGVLVGEVYYEKSSIGDAHQKGINVGRFKMEARSAGVVSCEHDVRLLQNSHVMMDMMMGLSQASRETERTLRIELHAPDEVDISFWKPIFTSTFPISVGFADDAQWSDFQQAVLNDGHQSQTNQKLARVQSAMRDDMTTIKIGSRATSECRLLAPVRPSESLWRDRRLFMGETNAETESESRRLSDRQAFRRHAERAAHPPSIALE